jgi:hypothetical protein
LINEKPGTTDYTDSTDYGSTELVLMVRQAHHDNYNKTYSFIRNIRIFVLFVF